MTRTGKLFELFTTLALLIAIGQMQASVPGATEVILEWRRLPAELVIEPSIDLSIEKAPLKWRLCFRQPVQMIELSELPSFQPWQTVEQGPGLWVYEITTPGTDGNARFHINPDYDWDVSCSRLNYQGKQYQLTSRNTGANQEIPPGVLPGDAGAQVRFSGGELDAVAGSDQIFVPVKSDGNFPQGLLRSKRQVPVLCPEIPGATPGGMDNSTGVDSIGVPKWSALVSVATFFVAHILGCCCTCMYFQAIYNCLHCQRGK